MARAKKKRSIPKLFAERVAAAEQEKADGSRVAELMERSASTGLGAATRLASTVRRLGVLLETHDQRRRRRQ